MMKINIDEQHVKDLIRTLFDIVYAQEALINQLNCSMNTMRIKLNSLEYIFSDRRDAKIEADLNKGNKHE